jgi:hypothetical protein
MPFMIRRQSDARIERHLAEALREQHRHLVLVVEE